MTQENRVRINCSFSKKELNDYKILKSSAKQDGYNVTLYLKKCAIAYIKQKRILPMYIEIKLDRLIILTSNLANNLNQIARYVNTVKRVTVFDLIKARMIVFKFEKAVVEFFKKDSL